MCTAPANETETKFLMSFSSTESSSADAELLGLQNTRVLESLLWLLAGLRSRYNASQVLIDI